jgi:hypothetical protein
MTTLKRLLPRQIGMLNNILKIIKTLERFQDLENGKTLVHHYQQIFHE